ncbi:uncharacterized protein LOC144327874 [Podarcis muralis]
MPRLIPGGDSPPLHPVVLPEGKNHGQNGSPALCLQLPHSSDSSFCSSAALWSQGSGQLAFYSPGVNQREDRSTQVCSQAPSTWPEWPEFKPTLLGTPNILLCRHGEFSPNCQPPLQHCPQGSGPIAMGRNCHPRQDWEQGCLHQCKGRGHLSLHHTRSGCSSGDGDQYLQLQDLHFSSWEHEFGRNWRSSSPSSKGQDTNKADSPVLKHLPAQNHRQHILVREKIKAGSRSKGKV